MKKILLSLMIMALASATAIGATRAYFSSGVVLGSTSSPNTFATGTVTIGGNEGFPMTVTGLAPGVEVVRDVKLGYTGTLNADMYLGVSGTDAAYYMGDFVKVKIYNPDMGWIYDGFVSGLSSNWTKIASNIGTGHVNDYHIVFYIDPNYAINASQGQSNTNTVFKIYAVQTGGAAPTALPYVSLTM